MPLLSPPKKKFLEKFFFGGGSAFGNAKHRTDSEVPKDSVSPVKSRIILRKTKQKSTFFDSFSVAVLYWCPEYPSETDTKKAEKRGECPLRRGFGSVFRPFFNQDGAEIQSVRYGSLNATPYAKRRGHRHRAWSRWSLPFARLQCGAPEGRSRPWGVRVQTGTLQRCPRDGIRRHAP